MYFIFSVGVFGVFIGDFVNNVSFFVTSVIESRSMHLLWMPTSHVHYHFFRSHATVTLQVSVCFKALRLGFGGEFLSFNAIVGGWSTRAHFFFQDSGKLERPLKMPEGNPVM